MFTKIKVTLLLLVIVNYHNACSEKKEVDSAIENGTSFFIVKNLKGNPTIFGYVFLHNNDNGKVPINSWIYRESS